MDEQLDQRIERYLSGALGADETIQFEQELADPGVFRAFQEALFIRELFKRGSAGVPEGLVQQIQDALGVEQLDLDDEKTMGQVRGVLGNILDGAGWMVRGPAMTWQAAAGDGTATAAMVGGLSTVSWALGTGRAGQSEKSERPAKRALWKRLVLRRRKR